MEALLWIFVEQRRGTYPLAGLGLISEQDWRDRVEDDDRSSFEYITAPQRLLRESRE